MAAIETLTIESDYVLLKRVTETIYEVVDSGNMGIPAGRHVLINSSVLRQEVTVGGERYEVFSAGSVIGAVELSDE
jgi:hypothetical protein